MGAFAVIAGACIAAWALDEAADGHRLALVKFIGGVTLVVAGAVLTLI